MTLHNTIDLDTAVVMARFYFNVAKPLADYFASWALEHRARETGHADAISKQGPKLKITEIMRLTRAIYRFQLLCDIINPHEGRLNNHQRVIYAQRFWIL